MARLANLAAPQNKPCCICEWFLRERKLRLHKSGLSALRALALTAANGRYLSNSARSNFRSLMTTLSLPSLVVHLFEAVVALIVTPIDEDGSVKNTWAILAPTFKAHMGLGHGSYRRSLP